MVTKLDVKRRMNLGTLVEIARHAVKTGLRLRCFNLSLALFFASLSFAEANDQQEKRILVFNPPADFFEYLDKLDNNDAASPVYSANPDEADIWVYFLGGVDGIEFLPSFFFEKGTSLVQYNDAAFQIFDAERKGRQISILISFFPSDMAENRIKLSCFVAGLVVQLAEGRDFTTLAKMRSDDVVFVGCK